MFNFFKNKKDLSSLSRLYRPIDDIVFNVDNFNLWFNSPINGYDICHSGIFLRSDKLSISMIEKYLKTQYNIITNDSKLYEFEKQISIDWQMKRIDILKNK